ncbi:hypothetical protein HK405_009283, partial [Cladochytrium tenue]
ALAREVKSGDIASSPDLPAGATPEEREAAARAAIKEFEAKFLSGPISKGQQLVFTKLVDGGFRMEYEGRELGVVRSRWLAERFFEGYLSHEKPLSNRLRASVADNLRSIVKGE